MGANSGHRHWLQKPVGGERAACWQVQVTCSRCTPDASRAFGLDQLCVCLLLQHYATILSTDGAIWRNNSGKLPHWTNSTHHFVLSTVGACYKLPAVSPVTACSVARTVLAVTQPCCRASEPSLEVWG